MAVLLQELTGVEELSQDEGEALFDRQARYYLSMSGDEFLRKWYSGEFADQPEDRNVMLVASLLPFAPQISAARTGLIGRVARCLKLR
jgi:hypothetical protein